MANLIGFNAIVGLAEQSDFATPVAADHWLPILSHSMTASPNITPVPFLGVANAQVYHNTRNTDLLSIDVGGDLDTIAMYDDKAFLLLLKHALGAVGSAIVGGGPQYAHTFSCDSTALAAGLTVETVHGSGISSKSEVWTGCRVNQLALSVDARGWMRATASLIGRSTGGATTQSSGPSAAVSERVRASVGSTFGWNSHTQTMRSFRLTLNNNLVRRPEIGNLYTGIIGPGGFASVMVDATFPWEDNNLYTDLISGVTANANVLFTGTGDNSMLLNLNNLRIVSCSRPVQSAGELTYSVRAMCSDNPGTNQGLGIVVKNDNTTAI
jgi:hypothetical protein